MRTLEMLEIHLFGGLTAESLKRQVLRNQILVLGYAQIKCYSETSEISKILH